MMTQMRIKEMFAFLFIMIAYQPSLISGGKLYSYTYSKCYSLGMQKDTYCLKDVESETEKKPAKYGCMEVLASSMNNKTMSCVCDKDRFGPNCANFRSKKAIPMPYQSWAGEGKGLKLWAPNDKHMEQLQGIYMVESLADCKSLCERFNVMQKPIRRQPYACGTITFEENSNDNSTNHLCEIYSLKPVGPCREYLKIHEGFTIAWLESVHKSLFSCH